MVKVKELTIKNLIVSFLTFRQEVFFSSLMYSH